MKQSEGILLFRRNDEVEFFLVHPGGPYFYKRNSGVPITSFANADFPSSDKNKTPGVFITNANAVDLTEIVLSSKPG